MFKVKRVYDPPEKNDGLRVLVDRVWPRGLSKEEACVSLWLKELAPSTELRKWFRHDVKKWREFQTRYRAELRERKASLQALRLESTRRPVTLLYGARNEQHNQAVVLKHILDGHR